MATAKVEDISSVRAYVFDYVCGIIWMLAAAATWLSPERLSTLDATVNSLAIRFTGISVPELIQGFLLAIAGIVLPYAVSTILRPASLRVMTISLNVHRRFNKWNHNRRRQSVAPADPTPHIEAIARDAVRKALDLDKRIRITREMQHVFLQGRHASMASAASRWQEDMFFRATAILPSSLFVAALAFNYSVELSYLASALAFALVFVISSWSINRDFESYLECLNLATTIAAKYPSTRGDEELGAKK